MYNKNTQPKELRGEQEQNQLNPKKRQLKETFERMLNLVESFNWSPKLPRTTKERTEKKTSDHITWLTT